jgi:hypothetical protein
MALVLCVEESSPITNRSALDAMGGSLLLAGGRYSRVGWSNMQEALLVDQNILTLRTMRAFWLRKIAAHTVRKDGDEAPDQLTSLPTLTNCQI